MEVLSPRCGGLDIHKRTVVACRVTPGPDGQPVKAIRTFGAMTADLLALGDWLAEGGCTHVAMEATGVYWKPIWNLLEDAFVLLLVNARHVRQVPGRKVPGRKTDVRDCEWLADLPRHGLLRGSFVPDRPQRELRELTRYRTSLVRARPAEANRLQKTLEGANVELGLVATDVLGQTGRDILAALVAGETDPAALAQLARGLLRKKVPQLEQALTADVGRPQRFLLAQHLAHIDFLEAAVAQVGAEGARRLRPLDEALARLDALPGIGREAAEALLAEPGGDVARFPTAKHLASWAGRCPGNRGSAGKRRSGATRAGSPWLRGLLVQAAHGAARTRGTYLAAQYRRLAARRGKRRAAVAVGHTILVIVYHLLRYGTDCHDLGRHYFDERDRRAVERRLVRRLEGLGYRVALEPRAA